MSSINFVWRGFEGLDVPGINIYTYIVDSNLTASKKLSVVFSNGLYNKSSTYDLMALHSFQLPSFILMAEIKVPFLSSCLNKARTSRCQLWCHNNKEEGTSTVACMITIGHLPDVEAAQEDRV